MKKSSGFTLIELLVVIAIIGLLASIVLASLNTARAKGSDAATKSAMGQLRAQAEMYYDDHGDYGSVNDDCLGMFTTMGNIIENVNQSANPGYITCSSDGNAWAASVTLKNGTDTWCVDSTGRSAMTTRNQVGGVACD